MSPFADSPVIIPERQIKEEKKPSDTEPPRIRCPLCGWSPRKETDGLVAAETNGTHSTREACAQLASTSGLRRSASLAADGRRTQIGMRIREKQEAIR